MASPRDSNDARSSSSWLDTREDCASAWSTDVTHAISSTPVSGNSNSHIPVSGNSHAEATTTPNARLATQIVIFVLCAIAGSMLPLAQDWTKSYPKTYVDDAGFEQSCEGMAGHTMGCRGSLPYIPGTAVLVDSVCNLFVCLAMALVFSGREGLRQCVNPKRLKMTSIIALFYVVGDIVQLMGIGATNASFFLVIGQVKLLATAIASLLLLSKRQSSVQWFLLLAITVTAALYCDLDLYFVQQKGRGTMELFGISLALFKVFLAAVNSVLTERVFKAGSQPIWVTQAQLKICAIPCSLLVLCLQNQAFCSHDAGDCLFSDTQFFHGWSWKLGVLLSVQVANNFVLALVYKHVDAVVKYLAYAQSLWITYLVNICILGVAFNFDLFLIIFILVLLVIAYSLAKPTAILQKAIETESSNLELRSPLRDQEAEQMQKLPLARREGSLV